MTLSNQRGSQNRLYLKIAMKRRNRNDQSLGRPNQRFVKRQLTTRTRTLTCSLVFNTIYHFTPNITETPGYNALQVRKAVKLSETRSTTFERRRQTFDLSAVSPAEFSAVCLPLCGPTVGFDPARKASNTFLVVSGVRSSCLEVRVIISSTECHIRRNHH